MCKEKRNIILVNAFSIQMIKGNDVNINFKEVSLEDVNSSIDRSIKYPWKYDFISAIGHKDLAEVLSSMIDSSKIEANRVNVSLDYNTTLYVAQLVGGRLPEGTTTLPEGFEIKFFKVETIENWECSGYREDGSDVTVENFIGTYSDAEVYARGLMPVYNGNYECYYSVQLNNEVK